LEELGLVRDLAIVWMAALVSGAICVRLKLPAIAGYVLAGIVIGPHGARLIAQIDQIHVLAELGVALLLFALGVEISLKKMFSSAGNILLAGGFQISVTVIIAAVLGYYSGLVSAVPEGLVFGFICALSSTAVVTKVLVDRLETESTHGRVLVPILLMQDLVLIPVVALLPALGHSGAGALNVMLMSVAKATLLIALVFGAAFGVVPRLLGWVSKSKSRELFVLTVICLCLGVALLSKSLGVSLALGAFLGGIMISERPFGHQVLADILPLRDLFATVFFVSIGMLLNTNFISAHWFDVTAFVALLVLGKALIAGIGAYIGTRSYWASILVGVGLAQMGEFSFVLATLAYAAGLVSERAYNLFFAGAVVSLVLSPALIGAAPGILAKIPRFRLFRRMETIRSTQSVEHCRFEEHVVLCGFGRMGRNVGLTLQKFRIPFVVIEVDGTLGEELQRRGIDHIYGDAFYPHVLSQANLASASCLVVTLPDPVVAMHVIAYARGIYPELRIVARANRSEDIDLFRASGANVVIQPEFEASVYATRITLLSLRRPKEEILAALRDIRNHGNTIFNPEISDEPFEEFSDAQFSGAWFSYAGIEQTIEQMDIRRLTGATVLAVKRDSVVIPHPQAGLQVGPLDQLYVAGSSEQLANFEQRFGVSRFSTSTEVKRHE